MGEKNSYAKINKKFELLNIKPQNTNNNRYEWKNKHKPQIGHQKKLSCEF